jgi:hypothetical protein
MVSVAAAGCGGAMAPAIDPHPLTEGGIPDRITLEAGPVDLGGDRNQPDGGSGDASSSETGGDLVVDGDRNGEAGDAPPRDGAAGPATLAVSVVDPTEGALEVAARRFTPSVSVILTEDSTGTDDVKQVDAELWSSGTTAAKISTTRLALLSKTAVGTDGGSADAASPTGDAATDADDSSASRVNVYSFGDTPIDLASLTTGTYELRVLVATLAGVTGMATRSFRADAGPIIQVIAPTADQASRGSVFVSVKVTDPFSTSPPVVNISVANIPITPLTIVGNLYQATVAETIVMPALSGEQLLDVGATNAAGVAARHVVVRFVFDDVGPIISNAKPTVGSLIGGIVKIEADVTDPAGVDPNTVTAVVAHGGTALEVKLDQDPNDKRHYAHLFDSRRLSNTVLYPTISFRASDVPGNQSNIGYAVAVDNTPPLADLDPPADLRVRRSSNGIWRCSWPFDPLGTDAVNDGDLVLQLFDVRARVEDEGNRPVAGGADITPLAGLDAAHVELLVLDDTNRALVVDSDGDGVCDAVNPRLVPTTTPMSSQDALLVNLAVILPVGTADFTPDASFPAAGFPDCGNGGEAVRPLPLCKTTDMTVAITARDLVSGAVWTIPNVVPATLQCVGNQFDSLGNQVTDGPACLAVRAVDRLGNAQVSRVLHVCVDHDGDGAECPYQAISTVTGGAPVTVRTASPHGLATGSRALIGAVPILFDANGLWTVTVVNSTTFTLDGSATPPTNVAGGRYMPWASTSDCTGRQTSINPVVIDDFTPCRPWRGYGRGEHLDAN